MYNTSLNNKIIFGSQHHSYRRLVSNTFQMYLEYEFEYNKLIVFKIRSTDTFSKKYLEYEYLRTNTF